MGVADGSKIIVFNVPSFEPSVVLRGHTATVHDIDFGDSGGSGVSYTQVVLASASGDQTARVWMVKKVSVSTILRLRLKSESPSFLPAALRRPV